jgi:paraquat-inducible protein A
MGGVIYFLETGSWPLALLIFFASIVVPVFKLVVLSFLSLVSVHRRSHWRPEWRARLYRMTEVVGKWSHSFDPRLLWDAMEGTDG